MIEIDIDGTKYGWGHDPCHCSGHCNLDKFYVDGEFYGQVDNAALCDFVRSLIVEVQELRSKHG